MKKIPEVETARALMTEAMDWSVMKWLGDKKRVRKTADKANEVLDALEVQLQATWSNDLKKAYAELPGGKSDGAIAADVKQLAKKLHDAFDAAHKGRMDAEETFDKAEKRLSTSLAREGCHKAIAGWNFHEEALRLAESAARGASSIKSAS